MLEAGNYHGIITNAVANETKKGNDQIVIVFDVTHVALEGEWSLMEAPVERRAYLSLTDGAWPYTQKKLQALDFNADFLDPRFKPDVYTQGLDLVCTHDTYEGKVRERWDFDDWGGMELEPGPEDKARRLNAKWRAKSATALSPASRPPSPASAPVDVSAPVPVPAPATAAAPPAPPAPAAPTALPEPASRIAAWNYLQGALGEKTQDERNEHWRKCVDDVATSIGTPEDRFTSENWQAVIANIDIPF